MFIQLYLHWTVVEAPMCCVRAGIVCTDNYVLHFGVYIVYSEISRYGEVLTVSLVSLKCLRVLRSDPRLMTNGLKLAGRVHEIRMNEVREVGSSAKFIYFFHFFPSDESNARGDFHC